MAKVRFNKGYVKVDNNKGIGSLSEALAEDAKCGCGLECDCYGYLVLPSWNSSTGARTDGYAIYIVDGAVKVDTVANAKVEIDAYKAL